MTFVVLPALVVDISAIYDVYFAAFKHNPITRALFPSTTDDDLLNPKSEFRQSHTVHTLQYWQTSSTQYSVKCVDTETGLIVGMALWDVYLTSSDWKKGEVSWLEGEEKERADALISPLWTAREHFWRDEKYLYCHVIAVHPDHQRKGIGELLFNFGRSIAEQTRLPIYIESSREAERLYYKMGCHVLRHRPVHKAEDLWPEKTNGAGEDCDVALFVWVPDNKVMKLPEKVVLA